MATYKSSRGVSRKLFAGLCGYFSPPTRASVSTTTVTPSFGAPVTTAARRHTVTLTSSLRATSTSANIDVTIRPYSTSHGQSM
ncbi:hypothetical protein KP79_PYT03108 [Mizuhopecten yessoensis]|uniref:Uncharacterized protein n=1 Tax=Mizuhopecten yessoensis TaxID=6573 RepID=A0A210PJA6_MIZYE|nr:hypothetical protein KP79_PYT03108 [Mizuhopecten yessoensis]